MDTNQPHRTLTDADITALADALRGTHTSCNLGLTNDEVTTLKRLLRAFNGAANIVGCVVLTAIVGGIIAIISKGFWVSMVSGIKEGVPK